MPITTPVMADGPFSHWPRRDNTPVERPDRSVSDAAAAAFLDGLTALSRATGVAIRGCGCCGSPSLKGLLASERAWFAYHRSDDEPEVANNHTEL